MLITGFIIDVLSSNNQLTVIYLFIKFSFKQVKRITRFVDFSDILLKYLVIKLNLLLTLLVLLILPDFSPVLFRVATPG